MRDHFINNQWIIGKGEPFVSRNPVDNSVVWTGHAATDREVTKAVMAAHNAFPKWSNTPLNDRKAILEKFRDEVNASANLLAEAISQEVGKPLWESKTEVAAMSAKVDITIEAYAKRCAEMIKDLPAGHCYTRHKPHGVLAVFGPFNFPGHLPNGHIVPALLAGNTIVFKPSELTPYVAELTVKLWEKAGLPPGVLNLIQGGKETGIALAADPEIDGLLFTGSWQTGMVLSNQFGKHPEKILALEMGGNNPLVIGDISDAKAAALMTIQSAYLTAGQRCTCARRLIVIDNKKTNEFLSELTKLIDNIKVGSYKETPEPFMGPVISIDAVRAILAAQEALKSSGGTIIREVLLKEIDTALLTPGLIDVTDVPNRPDEEIFGPLLQLIRVKDFNAAIEEANHTQYGLTAGLLSNSEEEFHQFYQQVKAGVINWNTPTTGSTSSAPFGGIGRSGNFRPSGYYSVDYCVYPVASTEVKELKLPTKPPPGITL